MMLIMVMMVMMRMMTMVEPMVMTIVMSANTNCTVDGQGMCVVYRGQDDDDNVDDDDVDDENVDDDYVDDDNVDDDKGKRNSQ